MPSVLRPAGRSLGWSVLPAGDVEDRSVAAGVVLDADVEVLAGGIEEPAGPLGVEVVQRADPDAAVRQRVVVAAVVEAAPEVVVAAAALRAARAAVLVDDPVPGGGLVGDVVRH